MSGKQVLTRKRRAKTVRDDARERLVAYLQKAYPSGFCRVLTAPDGRMRVLVIDDQFNGVEFTQKHKFVLEGLNRAVACGELLQADRERISSVDVFSPQELV